MFQAIYAYDLINDAYEKGKKTSMWTRYRSRNRSRSRSRSGSGRRSRRRSRSRSGSGSWSWSRGRARNRSRGRSQGTEGESTGRVKKGGLRPLGAQHRAGQEDE